jgi:hypothetical protein
MTTALESLVARWSSPETFDYAIDDVFAEQLAAASERFIAHRAAIRVLDRRATDAGIDEVGELEDLIPLLFSHTTYKSYPETFIKLGRWDRLAAWLGTLSTSPVGDIDFAGVEDIDGWMERLHAAGHRVTSSSGTSGRTSFLDMTTGDVALMGGAYIDAVRAVTGVDGADRAAFLAIPPGGTTVVQVAIAGVASALAREGDVHYVSEEPLRAAQLAKMGALRRAIAEGTATPGDIAQAEREAREREDRMGAEVQRFVAQVLERRAEPLLLAGTVGFIWRIVEGAKRDGVPDGSFHQSSLIFAGGGLKGVSAPDDFEDQMRAFFGADVGQFQGYGMSELIAPFPRCAVGRYHAPPTTVMLVLDKSGERLAGAPEGTVEGRFAALELLLDGRWGGVISGDKVTVDYDPCPCGRASPTVVQIARYSDLAEGDDKLSCSGTLEAYVRGEIGVAA